MKILITYSSLTGNTKKVAEAIHEVMPKGSELLAVNDEINIDLYDFIITGTWIDKGHADLKTQAFIEKIKNKKTAFFFTLGAPTDSEHAVKCSERISELFNKNSNELLGHYYCQGKINPKLLEKYKSLPKDHPHAMTEEREKRYDEASKHPNCIDLENAKIAFMDILDKI